MKAAFNSCSDEYRGMLSWKKHVWEVGRPWEDACSFNLLDSSWNPPAAPARGCANVAPHARVWTVLCAFDMSCLHAAPFTIGVHKPECKSDAPAGTVDVEVQKHNSCLRWSSSMFVTICQNQSSSCVAVDAVQLCKCIDCSGAHVLTDS